MTLRRCIHQAVEPQLEALGCARMNNGVVAETETSLEPACQKCQFSWQEDTLPAVLSSHQSLRDAMECHLSDGRMLSEDLGAFFFKSKAEVWSADMTNITHEELRKSCNCLVGAEAHRIKASLSREGHQA